MTGPGLHILMPDEVPEDQSNNITLAEVVQSERALEFMVTVLIAFLLRRLAEGGQNITPFGPPGVLDPLMFLC